MCGSCILQVLEDEMSVLGTLATRRKVEREMGFFNTNSRDIRSEATVFHVPLYATYSTVQYSTVLWIVV